MKKIGITMGVFDLFHVGHLNLLERCKQHCDYLIAGVCDDQYVRDIKHHEPVIGENDRLRIVGALKCVDQAALVNIEETIDKVKAYKRFNFNVVFVGDDWKGSQRFIETEKAFKDNGLDIEIVFLPYTKGVSTTQLKEQLGK